jgi:small subunit ribosomal protein S2
MADQQATEKTASLDFSRIEAGDEVYEDMAKHGVLYGHKKSRKNPKFADYVFATRNGSEVLDLQKTLNSIEIAASVLKKNKDEKKAFLLVGTQPAAHEAVRKLADALGSGNSCITGKWTGGLITNFPVLGKRLEYLKKRQADMKDGRFEKYTKKERLMIEREIEKLSEKFAGLENMDRVPDVLFVVDGNVKNHRTAIREARIKGMLIMGIIDNDDNPDDFNYFIPANDHAKASIDWVVNALTAKL